MAEMGWLGIVRHGQSTGNVAADAAESGRLDRIDIPERDADVPLSDTGREQATSVGRWLARLSPSERPDVVVVSPYLRAVQTAEIALGELDADPPVRRDERLRDRELGILDLLTNHGVRTELPAEADRRHRLGKFYYRPPGGESWADVAGRVRAVLEAYGPAAGERLLIVTHQAVLMLFRYVLEVLDEQQVLEIDRTEGVANTSVTVYAGEPTSMRLQTVGDVRHLDASAAPLTEEGSWPARLPSHPRSCGSRRYRKRRVERRVVAGRW
jgi:broad specificity phosphatase PhoE